MVTNFNYGETFRTGLLICAGGFETRSLTFAKRLEKHCEVEKVLILRYESQREDNEPNFIKLYALIEEKTGKVPEVIPVDANYPILSCVNVKARIESLTAQLTDRRAFIDISGMTHLWALYVIHACLTYGLKSYVIYTEARWYYPPKNEQKKILSTWKNRQYDLAAEYLQSAGLKAIQILPEFGGNFRPGKQACLMIFVGYEPNRIEGLVDSYAPGALVILYGKSPRKELWWRTQFSKELHQELFSKWYIRETEISTLEVATALTKLEDEFKIIKDKYDVAIAPQCSKMQGLASYLFWKRHPEIQLVFTSPVTFNPIRYSRSTGKTFIYKIA